MSALKIDDNYISLKRAAAKYRVKESYLGLYIRKGIISVRHFNGKPIKPYQIFEPELKILFCDKPIRSLTTKEIGKLLGHKSHKKETLWLE
jgi:hypothetical protein